MEQSTLSSKTAITGAGREGGLEGADGGGGAVVAWGMEQGHM